MRCLSRKSTVMLIVGVLIIILFLLFFFFFGYEKTVTVTHFFDEESSTKVKEIAEPIDSHITKPTEPLFEEYERRDVQFLEDSWTKRVININLGSSIDGIDLHPKVDSIILVDAMFRVCEYLQATKKPADRYLILCVAVHGEDGWRVSRFREYNKYGASSTLVDGDANEDYKFELRSVRNVITIPAKDLINEVFEKRNHIAFYKTDLQGFDGNVFYSLGREVIKRFLCVQMECRSRGYGNYYESYKGEPRNLKCEDFAKYLVELGFTLHGEKEWIYRIGEFDVKAYNAKHPLYTEDFEKDYGCWKINNDWVNATDTLYGIDGR